MGLFFNRLEPRQFRFRPFYYKPGWEKRIRFRRFTRYDPRERSRLPWLMIFLAILVGLTIMILGGIRPISKPPALEVEDAVESPIMESTK